MVQIRCLVSINVLKIYNFRKYFKNINNWDMLTQFKLHYLGNTNFVHQSNSFLKAILRRVVNSLHNRLQVYQKRSNSPMSCRLIWPNIGAHPPAASMFSVTGLMVLVHSNIQTVTSLIIGLHRHARAFGC